MGAVTRAAAAAFVITSGVLSVGVAPSGAAVSTCAPGSVHRLGATGTTYAATAIRRLRTLDDTAGRSRLHFSARNANGVPTVFAVIAARFGAGCLPTAYHVLLPVRPNGSTGWIRAADVRLSTVHTRIAIDLSQRRVTLFRSGRPVLVASAAVGSSATPTPTGRFYVNQRLLSSNPLGSYGPGAVGISAFSPVLHSWPQGGPIAIHGTDAPQMIGFAVSHGCLRLRNVDIRVFLRLAVEGTPVTISA